MDLIYYRTEKQDNSVYYEYVGVEGERKIKQVVLTDKNMIESLDSNILFRVRLDNTIKSILSSEVHRLHDLLPKMSNKELSKINFGALTNYKSKFFDSRYNKLMQQVVQTITHLPLKQELSLSEKIRMWLKHVSIIGKGAYGVALKAGINKVDDLLVIKYNLNRNLDSFGITHEYVVGNILNQLRLEGKAINAVFTYGGFLCGESPTLQPSIGKNTDSKTFCYNAGHNTIEHILMEFIPGSITLFKFLKGNISFDDFLSVFLSIVHFLVVANNELGFTHWDLHGDNILIAEEPLYRNYWSLYKTTWENKNSTAYIKTNGHIPYIIDYGQSSIRTPSGTYLGPLSQLIPNDHYRGEPFFCIDIYKVIVSVLEVRQSHDDNIHIFAKLCLEKLFMLTRDEINIILSNISVKETELTPEKVRNSYSFRLPPIPEIANDFNRVFVIISEICTRLKFDTKKIWIPFGKLKKPENILSCSSGHNICPFINEKLVGDVDNYLDLCYSGKKLKDIDEKKQYDIVKSIEDDLNKLSSSADRIGPLLLDISNRIQQLLDKSLSSYSEGGGLLKTIIKIYSDTVEFWTVLEEINDLYHVMSCIGLKKYQSQVRNYLQDKLTIYRSQLVPTLNTIRKIITKSYSISKMGEPIDKSFIIFFSNWELYQYIIDLSLPIEDE